jgi:hypothetical protein
MRLDREQWRRGYHLALCDYALTRVGLYLVAQTQRDHDFLARVIATTNRLVRIEVERELGSFGRLQIRASRGLGSARGAHGELSWHVASRRPR